MVNIFIYFLVKTNFKGYSTGLKITKTKQTKDKKQTTEG